MSDYFTAYRERMISIDRMFRSLAIKLIQRGCRVFHSKDGLIFFLSVVREDGQLVVGFTEVPYRFYISINTKPDKKQGSSYTKDEAYYSSMNYDDKQILDADYLVSQLGPHYMAVDKFIEERLTFLTEFKL